MITRRTILRAGLLAAYFSTWGWSGNEPGKLMAQADALIVGNEHIIFPDGGGSIQSSNPALPSHPLGTPNAYHGEIPMQSQHIRSTGDGRILFFEVNGNVYDGNGWLIADARGPNCTDCIESGVMEFISIPVPGECGLFYLLSATPRNPTYSGTHIQWSVLDMNQDNLRFPSSANNCSKKGRLLDMEFDSGSSGQTSELVEFHPQFPSIGENEYATFFENSNDGPSNEAMNWYYGNSSTKVARLYTDLDAKDQAPQIRVVAPSTGSDGFIFLSVSSRIYVYRVTDHGLYSIHATPENWFVPLLETEAPIGSRAYFQDSDAIRTANGIAFAMNGCGLQDYPGFLNEGSLATMLFNGATGLLVPNSVLVRDLYNGELECQAETATDRSGLFGCAFRPDGLGVYVTGSRFQNNVFSPYLGHIDLVTNAVLDRSSLLPAGTTTDHMRQRLYHGKDPVSNNDALFLPKATGINVIYNIATPNLAAWNGTLLAGNVQNYVSPTPISTQYMPYYINDGVSGDAYLTAANRLACCTFLGQTGSGVVEGLEHTGTASWSNTNNPYGNASILTFSCDLVVKPGANLTISNLTLKFADDAKIIVERGGKLVHNTTIATSLTCPNVRWPGIRVEGTTADQTQSTSNQGRFTMNSSTVENAETGVWCAKEQTTTTGVLGYYGGIFRSQSNSVFRNCITGVRIENYHRYGVNGSESPNFSALYSTNFETTATWPLLGSPGTHVDLRNVSGIKLGLCNFKNLVPQQFSSGQQGRGIYAYNAGFNCYGNSSYANYRFEDLSAGIVASDPNPAVNYTVEGMGFIHNHTGIMDFGSTDSRIVNNLFEAITTGPSSSRGVHLYSSERYVIERNTFTRTSGYVPAVGIYWMGSSYANNEIYDNDFTNLTYGCLATGTHTDFGSTQSTVPGLQWRCGTYTNNETDQYVHNNSYIRHDQGLGSNASVLANNQFFGTVDCDPGLTGPSFNSFVGATQPYGFYCNYHFYDNAANPEMRQDCIELSDGTPLSLTGEYFYDLLPLDPLVAFDKVADCGSGILDVGGTGGVNMLATEYTNKQAELNSAVQFMKSKVDNMKTGDVKGLILHEPAYPSYAVRDSLLANHPLSDDVLKLAIHRTTPLDSWHLTQVLINNSPLSRPIAAEVKNSEVLPPYFYNLLQQFRNGVSERQLLEMEVVQRQQEATILERRLLQEYTVDSTLINPDEIYVPLFTADSLGTGMQDLYLYYLMAGHYSSTQALEATLQSSEWTNKLVGYGQILASVNGDINALTANQRLDLHNMAMETKPAAGALAWATLLATGDLDSIPDPELPVTFKSFRPYEYTSDVAGEVPVIGVLPNPATDQIAFTYPKGTEDGILEVHDAQGRLVRTIALNGRQGLIDDNVRKLEAGMYSVRLLLDGLNIGTSKFTVVK